MAYKVKKYNQGGECPPGDIDCMREKGLIPPSLDSELLGFVPQMPKSQFNIDYTSLLNTEDTDRGKRQPVSPLSLESADIKPFNPEAPELDIVDVNPTIDTPTPENTPKTEKNYNIPNPYAGVDIPTAAFTLGQSIEDGNTLGTVGSALKVATGIGRNLVSGMGYQNRYDQVMQEYMEDQKRDRNPVQYLAYGGKKDEELATGEYMHGVMNEDLEQYNAEVEQGEYFQSNQGDIAEIVGDKHNQGGEKIQMEPEDRVLSDQLKLGAKVAKELSEKYELKLKAKNTYADVLDKFKKKSKLGKLIEEEAEVLKMIGEQSDVQDPMTRDLNLKVLKQKRNDILAEKDPIEEKRKEMFEELFNIQEDSKPKTKEDNNFAEGGKLEALASEYGIELDRAKEIIEQYKNGGKKKGSAKKEARKGQSKTDAGFFGNITQQDYEDFVQRNSSWFNFSNFDVNNEEDVKQLQEAYNSLTLGNKVDVDGKFGEQTASLSLNDEIDLSGMKVGVVPLGQGPNMSPEQIDLSKYTPSFLEQNIDPNTIVNTQQPQVQPNEENDPGLAGMYLFPTESPLPPSALQGTIKPNRRFDRVTPTEIEIEPYLRDIRDREGAQVQSLEGLSPNVRAAVLANIRANSQKQESQIRNQIDTQNLSSQEKAIYTNAQIQAREENASEIDNLRYEQRQYRAQALTDNDLNNYYNQLQTINKQRFMDIHNLNLVNATNEDVAYVSGRGFVRKNSDRDILRQVKI